MSEPIKDDNGDLSEGDLSNGELPEKVKLEIELDGKMASDLLVFAHMQGMDIKLYCEYILEEKWGAILDIMQVEH